MADEVPLLDDNAAALAILRELEAGQAKLREILEQSFARWREQNEALKKVLATGPAQGF